MRGQSGVYTIIGSIIILFLVAGFMPNILQAAGVGVSACGNDPCGLIFGINPLLFVLVPALLFIAAFLPQKQQTGY